MSHLGKRNRDSPLYSGSDDDLEPPAHRLNTTRSPMRLSPTSPGNSGFAKSPRPPSPHGDARARSWFLTYNNPPTIAITKLLAITGLTKYVIQEETGDDGTPHLQGLLTFKNAKLWSTLRNVAKAYWKPCRNVAAAKQYCSKARTRTGKQWIKGYYITGQVNDPLEGKTLYDYQEHIIALVQTIPDERKINWYWSNKGSIGKSCLCKHLCLKHNAIVMGGKVRDSLYAIAQRVAKGQKTELIIFDIPRFQGNKVSYVAMENLKNGCFFSSKYEASMCLMNPPHIIVFANEAPDRSWMSKDRWNIKQLDGEKDLQHITVY